MITFLQEDQASGNAPASEKPSRTPTRAHRANRDSLPIQNQLCTYWTYWL